MQSGCTFPVFIHIPIHLSTLIPIHSHTHFTQDLLEAVPMDTPAIVDWHAAWAAACRADAPSLASFAASNPAVLVISIDVEASQANTDLANEKVRGRWAGVQGKVEGKEGWALKEGLRTAARVSMDGV